MRHHDRVAKDSNSPIQIELPDEILVVLEDSPIPGMDSDQTIPGPGYLLLLMGFAMASVPTQVLHRL